MNMNLKMLAFVLVLSSVAFAAVSGWTMNGDGVYWQDNGYKISAYPAVSKGLIDQEQFVNFSSSNPANLVTNMSFVFPFQITKGSVALLTNMSHDVSEPVYGRVNQSTVLNVSSYALTSAACDFGDALNTYKYNVSLYGNVSSVIACFDSFSNVSSIYTVNYSYNSTVGQVVNKIWYPDWQDISAGFTHTDIGAYDVFTINNVQFNAGTNYQTRFRYSVPLTTSSGKFDIYAHTGSPADVVNGVAMVYLQLDPWWNASWEKRVPFYVNSTGAVSDYQVMINVNSTNFNMSEINSDCSDIRTTYLNSTGSELVAPYWVESCNTSGNSIVWAKVNFLAGNTTVNVYHKNTTAVTTTSDIKSTFIFGDDFTGNQLNTSIWGALNMLKTNVNNGELTISFWRNYMGGIPYLLQTYNYSTYGNITIDIKTKGARSGFEISTTISPWLWQNPSYIGLMKNGFGISLRDVSDSNLGYKNNNDGGSQYTGGATNAAFLITTSSYSIVSGYFNDVFKWAIKDYNSLVNVTQSDGNISFNDGKNYYISLADGDLNSGQTMVVDWFRLRKYTTETLVSSYGAAEVVPTTPTIGFSSQSPVNITSTTLYSQRIFLNYTVVSAGSGVNLSTVRMWYNMSKAPIVNGTLDVMPQSFSPASNISDLFLFNMGETKNYPGTYNVNQIVMQNTTHISRQLNTSDSWYSIKLMNITNNQTANVFEVMFNSTGSTQATDVWACNSSYTTGSISSPNCVILQTIPSSNAFNHSHPNSDNTANISKHHVIPMNINTTTGKIGTMFVTPTMTFLVKSPKNNPNLLVYGITGTARANAFAISTNGGTSWTADDTMIADAHVHQFDSITSNAYWVEACDLSSPALCANSTMRYVNSTAVPTGPSSPVVTSPTATSYQIGDTILTSWLAAIPGEGSVISNYSVHLLNSDDSVNQTIGVGIPLLNITGIAAVIGTDFRMRVTAFANNGLESIGLSPEFNITAIVPPSGNGTTVIVNVSVVNNFNITVNNTVIVNNTIYINNTVINNFNITVNNTVIVNNTNNINVTVNNTVNTNNTINVNVSVNNTVIVNVNSSTGTTTNATNNPASGGYVFTSSTAQAVAVASAGGNPLANLPIGQAFNPGSNIVTGQLFSFSGLTGSGFANIMTLLIVGIAAAIGISILKGAKE